jgi:hypothetical protein
VFDLDKDTLFEVWDFFHIKTLETGDVAEWWSSCLARARLWVQVPAPKKV